jgi:hypothetical protein
MNLKCGPEEQIILLEEIEWLALVAEIGSSLISSSKRACS